MPETRACLREFHINSAYQCQRSHLAVSICWSPVALDCRWATRATVSTIFVESRLPPNQISEIDISLSPRSRTNAHCPDDVLGGTHMSRPTRARGASFQRIPATVKATRVPRVVPFSADRQSASSELHLWCVSWRELGSYKRAAAN